jgi:hypothetical protein
VIARIGRNATLLPTNVRGWKSARVVTFSGQTPHSLQNQNKFPAEHQLETTSCVEQSDTMKTALPEKTLDDACVLYEGSDFEEWKGRIRRLLRVNCYD